MDYSNGFFLDKIDEKEYTIRMARKSMDVPQTPPSAEDYAAASRVAAHNQRRHARSTMRWGVGAVAAHILFPHAALLNDVVQIGTAIRGGQAVVDTVDRRVLTDQARAASGQPEQRYARQQAPAAPRPQR